MALFFLSAYLRSRGPHCTVVFDSYTKRTTRNVDGRKIIGFGNFIILGFGRVKETVQKESLEVTLFVEFLYTAAYDSQCNVKSMR